MISVPASEKQKRLGSKEYRQQNKKYFGGPKFETLVSDVDNPLNNSSPPPNKKNSVIADSHRTYTCMYICIYVYAYIYIYIYIYLYTYHSYAIRWPARNLAETLRSAQGLRLEPQAIRQAGRLGGQRRVVGIHQRGVQSEGGAVDGSSIK